MNDYLAKTRKDFKTDEEYVKYRQHQNTKENKRRAKIQPQINEKETKRRAQLKTDALFAYSEGESHCLHCGETDAIFLTIDHINGRKPWNHSRDFKGVKLYSWLKREDYPSGFQVLCWNWNQIKEKKEAEIRHSKTPHAIRTRKAYTKFKTLVFTKYSIGNKPECSCCEYDELDGLSIDHIDGRKNVAHKKDLWGDKLLRWIRDNNFPSGFTVLCFNCNSGRQLNNGICPHTLKKKS